MQNIRITKSLVSQVKPGVTYWDRELKGFGLRVHRSGSASYIVKGRDRAGKQFLKTIGSAKLLEPQEARDEARLILRDARLDITPEPKIITFEELSQHYLTQYARAHKRSWKLDEQRLRDYLLPNFGKLPIDKLSRQAYAAFHARIGSSKPVLANRLRELTARMYTLAQDWGFYPESAQNPGSRLKDFPEVSRDRWLTAPELERLNRALNEESNPIVRAIFRLLVLTGLRKRELTRLTWKEVDLTNKLLRVGTTKNGQPHWLPLSDYAVEQFKRLPRRTDNNYCFIGNVPGKPFVQVDKAWQRIRKRADLEDVVVHDLRRTNGSWLAQQGESLHVIGKILNQKSVQATEVYARLSERAIREAVEKSNEAITKYFTGERSSLTTEAQSEG